MFRINHIHVRASDPRATAEWYVAAFGFRILSDSVRPFGDRFVRCETADGGMVVNFSNPRPGEVLGPGDAGTRFGLEHFGLDSADIHADVARLKELGAELLEGPVESRPGITIAFLKAPDHVRIELIQRRSEARPPGSA